MAIAIFVSTNQVRDRLTKTAILNELGLEGDIRPIRGVIGKLLVGKHHVLRRFIIPTENLDQAVLIPGHHARTHKYPETAVRVSERAYLC